nr:MAG: hypothetical protein [Microviridae sp.]
MQPIKQVIKANERIVWTQATYSKRSQVNEPGGGKSLTIPDQSMTIREMIRRHLSGIPIQGNARQPIYNGDTYLPDPKTLDLVEIQDIIQKSRQTIKSANDLLIAKKKLEADKRQEEALEAKRKADLYDESQKNRTNNP